MTLGHLIPILQFAVGPVILISGVGLLLLSMTNRFGRVIDRARELTRQLRVAESSHRASVVAQLRILMRRARLVRAAIALAGLSVLLAATLVIVLFVSAVFDFQLAQPIAGLFVCCMLALIGSLGFFMSDINLSLRALVLEVGSLASGAGAPTDPA
ncbi:MAG: DUF2721 domain-containing protein [bacterium]